PGHMPLDLALRTIDQAAALGMQELQLSGGDPLLYPHLLEVISAAKRHPGVFVLMNSVGTGVTIEKARAVTDAQLGAWDFTVDTLDPARYQKLRGARNALPTIMAAISTVPEVNRWLQREGADRRGGGQARTWCRGHAWGAPNKRAVECTFVRKGRSLM